MGQPALMMSSKAQTLAPTDICFNVGPLGVPVPGPFPGKSIPMLWLMFTSKVMIENLPALTASSMGPICQIHGGPLGAPAGLPMGAGPLKPAVAGALKVKFDGMSACNEGAMYDHNSMNSPPAQACKGSKKVKIS